MRANKRRRVLARGARVVLFAVVGSLASCRDPAPPEGTLVVALESMPQNLDPRFGTDAASSRIGKLVFRSLTRTNERQQQLPDLALDWTMDEPLTVTFRLRGDAVFHDGAPVTADDVRATYESILDPATASPKRQELEFLAAIETPDARTVRFRMREPYAPFLEAAAIGILPRAALGDPSRGIVGSGPFRIAAIEFNHEVRLVAVEGHPGLREIRFRVIPDDTVRVLEAKKRTVHLVENAIEPENLAWLAGEPGICVHRSPGTTFHYLGMNLRDPHLRDLRVRRAIALAIDRAALVAHLLNGTARPATGLLAPSHWAYEPGVRTYPHDPAAARQLLDEAGLPDPDGDGPAVRFVLGYKTTPVASRRRIAETLQAELRRVGIGLDIRTFEWGTFYDDIRRGNFQLYALAWVGVADPDIYFSLLASSMGPPRGNNRGGFASAEIDRLVELGRRTFDPVERQSIYAEIQKTSAEELPFVPLWWSDNVVVQDERLCGFRPHPDGDLISLRTAWWNERPGARQTGDGPSPCGCADTGTPPP